MQHRYYHRLFQRSLRFIIPAGKSVLGLGISEGDDLAHTASARCVLRTDDTLPGNSDTFDSIFLNGSLGRSADLCLLLQNVQRHCHPSTRLIIYQHNYLWQWILSAAERFHLKKKEQVTNWLSRGDVVIYLQAAGFDVTRTFRRTLCPLHLFGIGPLINGIATILPFFDFLKVDQFFVARPMPSLFPESAQPQSLTICLTVRDEKDNIASIVQSLPEVCSEQEILFVEGHSVDGTREEIERLIPLYPRKHIRVIGQPGKGQGDAIRVGFKEAKGDIILLYEGDNTSDPRDIHHFYEAMRKGYFEFIEGSRFVYPLPKKAMPLLNKLGNIFFALWFSFFLGQRSTDVLSGIKAIRKRDYEHLYREWGFLRIEDPFGDFELLYGAARLGLKFGEIPMRYYPRTYGSSKSRVFRHGLRLLRMAGQGYLVFRRQ